MVGGRGPALNGDVPDNLPVLSRPRDGAMIAGVCAGLARRWQVDPNLLRIAAVVLAFFGGIGLAGYAVAVLLTPRDGTQGMPIRRYLPFLANWSTPAVVAATIIAAVVLLSLSGGFHGFGLGPGLVIVGVWFFGFRRHRDQRGSQAGPAPLQPAPFEPTPFERSAEAWRQRMAEQQVPGYESAALTATSEQPRWTQPYTDPADRAVSDGQPGVVAVREKPGWGLWWLALALTGAGLLAVSVVGLVLGTPVGALGYAAAVLAALGTTLVVAAWKGRPPLLLLATILVAVVTAGLLGSGLRAPQVGEVHQAYSSAVEVPPNIDVAAGEVILDLSTLQLDADEDLQIHVGMGSVQLTLPTDVATEVSWQVRAGSVSTGDTSHDGVNLSGTSSYPAAVPGAPTLRVTVHVELGDLELNQ